ncbi:hypothetical protein XELAEV_18029677mg [Xenopus laevis]|uniref:Uncharacterized protein n=1 Tax=Xenopus laevis TaxID=8355 RepID=A0A974HHZ4_XENLA|nr:hypothetical protein XELAEV_18029677mg [Xenopus laevis]
MLNLFFFFAAAADYGKSYGHLQKNQEGICTTGHLFLSVGLCTTLVFAQARKRVERELPSQARLNSTHPFYGCLIQKTLSTNGCSAADLQLPEFTAQLQKHLLTSPATFVLIKSWNQSEASKCEIIYCI